jgi:hypothetical protein
MDRSPEKSASITVTIQPSRLADGEFFSSLLELAPFTLRRMMRPPASASENRTHTAEKIGPRRYSVFFNRNRH